MQRFFDSLKNASASWTVWANAALLIVTALTPLFPADQFPKIAVGLMLVGSIGNLLLRIFKTDGPIIPPAEPVAPKFPPAIQQFIDQLETKFAWIRDAVKGRGKEIDDKTADAVIDSAAASLKTLRIPPVVPPVPAAPAQGV